MTFATETHDALDDASGRAPRRIVHRTPGHRHGPITRLVSPSDLGEIIKPFVFLDFFSAESPTGAGFGWHPHSGIATVTVLLDGGIHYEETTGAKGTLPAGGVEWMQAGNGVWHTGGPNADGRMRGYQLWVALPPEQENGPTASRYVQPDEVPVDGPVRVILGRHGGAESLIAAPPMNYFVVRLKAGDRWTYRPPAGHTVCWVAVHEGHLRTPDGVPAGALAVFESSNEPIEFVAPEDTAFVLGSAAPHPHDLALGYYSVHTSAQALERGENEIRRIAKSRGWRSPV
jgi:redox-sensitive bicupin YhaK (pirin superfamily)